MKGARGLIRARLSAGELYQIFEITPVRFLKRPYVFIASGPGLLEIHLAPGQFGLADGCKQYIGKQARMPSVPIWKWMHSHYLMVESRSQFGRCEHLVRHPVLCIGARFPDMDWNQVRRRTQIFSSGTVSSCPPPGLVEHAVVQGFYKIFSCNIGLPALKRPLDPAQNVGRFPFVQLTSGGDVAGNQISGFFMVEERRTGGRVEPATQAQRSRGGRIIRSSTDSFRLRRRCSSDTL